MVVLFIELGKAREEAELDSSEMTNLVLEMKRLWCLCEI